MSYDLHYDLCVIGGGINGVGVARDASARGLSVLLVEAQDLAGATSSASSKLIHGGLRYLEYLEFNMVREALKEREILLKTAPHLVRPAEFVFLQNEKCRAKWLTRLGLWLYDNIGGRRSLPASRIIELTGSDEYGLPILKDIRIKNSNAIIYSDCTVDDTRLVIANALDAAGQGARILNYTICEGLDICKGGSRWQVNLRDVIAGDLLSVSASMVVNATGPWVGKFLDSVGVGGGDPDLPDVRLVKGSHIILPRQYDGEHIYVLQQADKRIVFIAPYQDEYTLVGTTEEDYEGDPRDAHISDAEMEYLCSAVNDVFVKKILPSDVLFTFSGVRPLIDDGHENSSAVSREYMVYHHKRFDAPLLSVFGGKLTTYRALSEAVIDKLMFISGRSSVVGFDSSDFMIGGDLGAASFDEFFFRQRQKYSWLPQELLYRYARSYGVRMDIFLGSAGCVSDLGVHYGDQVFDAEIDYLVKHEWARSVDDIIWRRSKLGLSISNETIRNIEAALGQKGC